MRAFYAHLQKELRDQRAIWIAVAACLPVLTLLAFWAFAGRIVEAPLREAVPVIVTIALVLYLFAIGGDLFAGDARRGTLSFLRRQPRGLLHSFRAKVLVFVAGFTLVVCWEALILWTCWALWGRSIPAGLFAITRTAFLSPYVWGLGIVSCWVLLTSVWLKRGGIAALLAPLLLGGILAPAVAWLKAHPVLADYLLPRPERALAAATLGFVLVPLAAAGWSYLGGRRFARSAWSAVWRGVTVVGVVAIAAYAYAAVHVHESLELTPESSGFRIHQAETSPDGKRLFVDVRRVSQSGRFSPPLIWSVDVATGSYDVLGELGESIDKPRVGGTWNFPGAVQSSLEPQPRLILRRARNGGDVPIHGWVDASTGEILKVLPASVRTPEVRAWQREAGRLASWTRDDSGRRVWLASPARGAPLCREGSAPDVPPEGPAAWYHAIPGGFAGWSQHAGSTCVVLDATTGRVEAATVNSIAALRTALSPRRILRLARDEERNQGGWVLADLRTGEREVLEGSPTDLAILAVLERHCVLGKTGGPRGGLVVWDPEAGTRDALAWPAASEGVRVAEVRLAGRDGDGVLAFAVRSGNEWGVALLDPKTRDVSVLAEALTSTPHVFALMDDRSVLAIEAGTRVVRYGPNLGQRTLLFPK